MTDRIDLGASFNQNGITNRPDVGVGNLFVYGTITADTTAGSMGPLPYEIVAYLATTAALTGTYNNGPTNDGRGATFTFTATGLQAIDGTNLFVGCTVFLRNQASGLQNGLYVCTNPGSVGVAAILQRSTAMNQPSQFLGAQIFVANGTANAGKNYQISGAVVTVGVTAVTVSNASFHVTATSALFDGTLAVTGRFAANSATLHPTSIVAGYVAGLFVATQLSASSTNDSNITTLGQGAYFGWNRSGGTGETNFINHKGGGGGAWTFINTNGTTFTIVATLNGSGIFQTNGYGYLPNNNGVVLGSVTLDFSTNLSQIFQLTASTNCTVNFNNPPYPCMVQIRALGAATTTPTITWTTAVKGTALQTTITATKQSFYELWWDGTSYWNITGITLVNL
jgi:hypothetical protein